MKPERPAQAALLLALACVVALACAGWRSIVQLRADVALTKHTREVQNQIGELRVDLLDAQQHQRALLSTQDDAHFERYLAALRALHADMDSLAALTADHPEQGPDMARLQGLVQQRRDELKLAIEHRAKLQGPAPPDTATDDREGAALMQAIGDVLERMDHEEARDLAAHEAAAADALRWHTGVGLAALALAVLLLAALRVLMQRERRSRARAERAEAEHRALLERDIEARSRELAQASQALTLSEARLRGIFESAIDGILTIDEAQTILMANPAAARMLRCELPQLMGSSLDRFIPEPARAEHRDWVAAFGASFVGSRPMNQRREIGGLRADGEAFPVEAAISYLQVDGQRLYTVILRDITEYKRAEAQGRRMQRELAESHADLRRLVFSQGRVQEEERKRIARELHDDLQQKLAAVLINLSAAAGTAARERAQALAAATELTGEAVESTRRIVNDLRPRMLDELGLVAALNALAAAFGRDAGIACEVHADARAGERAAASPDVATCLYRVAQEALNNVAKHARARRVRIDLVLDDAGALVLRVHDDGGGIDTAAPRKPGSVGVLGMQERLRMLGGRLALRGGAGEGTTVEAVLPADALVPK